MALRVQQLIIATGCAFALAIVGAAGFDAYFSHREATARAERELAQATQVLAERMERLLAAADKTLAAAALAHASWRSQPAHSPASGHVLLHSIAASSDIIQDIAWVDADGIRRVNSRSAAPAPLDFSAREFFTVHREDANRGLFVSRPLRALATGEWISPISRRLNDADGRFGGVVTAVIDMAYLNALLHRFHGTNGATYSIFLTDGVYLARAPDSESRLGQSAAGNNLFQGRLRNAPSGRFTAKSSRSDEIRLFDYRSLRTYPVVVVASFARSAALAGWHGRIRITGALTTLALIGAGLATFLILAQTRRLQHERREAFEARLAAEHANRAKTEFLAHMSHEMRTPMNAILGFTEMMSKEVFGPIGVPKYKEYLGHVATSGQHLLQVINNILDLAKVEAGKWVMEEELVEVRRLATDTVQLVGERARGAGIRLEIDPAAPPLALWADPRLLRQILLNLLVNGIKFTERGGKVRVTWRREEGGGAALAVSDTGCGMSAADMVRVLEPFGRGSAELARTRHDTGLGLPICKRFAEMHGGTFDIASVKGKGSIFTVHLPQERVRQTPPPAAEAPPARRPLPTDANAA